MPAEDPTKRGASQQASVRSGLPIPNINTSGDFTTGPPPPYRQTDPTVNPDAASYSNYWSHETADLEGGHVNRPISALRHLLYFFLTIVVMIMEPIVTLVNGVADVLKKMMETLKVIVDGVIGILEALKIVVLDFTIKNLTIFVWVLCAAYLIFWFCGGQDLLKLAMKKPIDA